MVFGALAGLLGCGRFGYQVIDASARDAEPDAASDADTRLPGLLAWYAMDDDPSDGTIDDSGGSARVARCVVGITCPTTATGHRGNAAAFDGISQYARITYGAWLATPTAYSIAAWIYLDTQIDQVAFAKPYSSGSLDAWGVTAWAPSSGSGTCLETVNALVTTEWVCGPALPAARWLHVAGRWDGEAKAVFIDGVKVGERLNAPSSLIDTHDVIIGGDENSANPAYLFHGKVDELQLYDRALTDAEIAMLASM